MASKVGGQRPRPRVALLGNFEAGDLEIFKRMFPTIWQGDIFAELNELVDIREIDLLVIASGIGYAYNWPLQTHVICFSQDIPNLPGPVLRTNIVISANAETEEFIFPDIPLPLSRRRDADYSGLSSVRGWPRLSLKYINISVARAEAAKEMLAQGAIICERSTNSPLAVYFLREDSGLGVAWLPNVNKNQAAWVELIVAQWAQSDKESFPDYGDWTDNQEWMTTEELTILSQIHSLEKEKQESIIKIDKQIGKLHAGLALAKTSANKGLRRLLTTQSEELVDEVAKALSGIGFNVTRVDSMLTEKAPKREDLRLSHLGDDKVEWNAIIEVRGYARSAGTTADLLRLARFSKLYEKEIGQSPDKLIYIVNGQIELLPPQRQEPLVASPEDLQLFAESDGLVIWTVELFRALKAADPSDYIGLLESIKQSVGRWIPPSK